MSIILRTLKGSALTYEEMDRNLSQYFYSSSIHNNGGRLRLHYTGSNSLDTAEEDYGPDRFHEVAIGTDTGGGVTGVSQILAGPNIIVNSSLPNGQGIISITGSAGGEGGVPGGVPGSVQFKVDGTTFGGDESYFYSTSTKKLGLGTVNPEEALHVVGDRGRQATVKLATDGGIGGTASITFFNGTQKLGSIGKTEADSNNILTKDIYIVADRPTPINPQEFNKIHSQIGTKIVQSITGAGIGINTISPNKELTIITPVNGKGIGIGQNTTTQQSEIKPITSEITNNLLTGTNSQQGLVIHPSRQNPDGGNVIIGVLDKSSGLNYTGVGDPGPNKVTVAAFTAGGTLSDNLPIASFLSNRTVGINTNSPSPRVRLDINGQYRGAYKTQTTYANLDFNNFSTIQVTSSSTIKVTGTLISVPLQGVQGTLIIAPTANHDVEFSSSFKTNKTAGAGFAVEEGKLYTISFISNGTFFIETSRTGPLT